MDMDIDAFYREQDKRMNLPDEDVDDYLNRIGARRIVAHTRDILTSRSEEYGRSREVEAAPSFRASAVASDVPQQADSVTPRVRESAPRKPSQSINVVEQALSEQTEAAPDDAAPQLHNMDAAVILDCPAPFSTSPAVVVATSPSKKQLVPRTHKRTTATIDKPDTSPQKKRKTPSKLTKSQESPKSSASKSSTASQIAADAVSYHVDDSSGGEPSSFEYVPTPFQTKQASPRKHKRKALADSESSPRQKKRSKSPPGLYRTPSVEEITSFRTSPRILKKGLPPLGPSKGGREAKGDKLRNIPALDFKTLVPPTRKTSGDTDPPTSPIEDITLNPSATPRSLQAGASELYLEIQQRVAQHTSAKRRDKVIRKSTEPGDAMDHGASAIMYVSSSSSPLSSSPPLPVASVPAKGSSKKLQSSSTTLQSKKSTKAAKGKKEKPALMTPVEYAQQLQDKAKARTAAAVEKDHDLQPSPSKFLHGKTIFYTGGDMTYASVRTRGRMDKIVRHGGTLVPRFDASVVTHIVTDAPYPSTLRALGLKNLSDIPDHIPTVKWNWIVTSIGRSPTLTEKGLRVRMDEVWLWAAFLERMDAGTEPRPPSRANGKGKGKAHIPENTEFSLISEFTQDRPRRASSARSIHEAPDTEDESEGGGSGGGDGPKGALLYPPTSPERHRKRASSSLSKLPVAGPSSNGTPQEDPLAEFYDLARAEHEIGWARRGEVEEPEATPSDSDIEEPLAAPAPRKRGWTCDKREVQRQTCVNQDIIDKLGELKTLHQAKLGDDDRWRAFSYSKCIPALRNHPKRITSFAEARAIRGVGEKTAIKIMEIVKTGELRRIGYEKTEDFRTTQLFQGVYGVGQSTGYRWYAAGCRTLEDVLVGKGGVSTSPAQEIGIRFYDDINNRMPREEAREIFELIKPIALDIDPKLYVEIMGSYRRGKADCGDIDILITRPTDDGNTHKGVLSRLLKALHIAGILTEDLALPENPDDLEAIYRGLSRVPGREGARRRRIDFLTVPWHSRGAALLYYTGDDIFNRAIRMKAGVLGYSLNQKGLFAGVVRDPRDRRIKLNAGTVVASETEEEIFKILNVPWQEPHERVRG